MEKIIYSSLVGNYDNVPKQPFKACGWRYVLFTDLELDENASNGWEIRPLKHVIENDNVRTNRWHKINSHVLFPYSKYIVYLDANILITGDQLYKRVEELIETNTLISCVHHPERDSIYDEINICIRLGKDSKKKLLDNLELLRNEKYPENNGLFECGLIFRNNEYQEEIKLLNNTWWEMVKTMSRRDQLSFNYVLWKNGFNCESFFKLEGVSVRNAEGFMYDGKHKANNDFVEISYLDLKKLKDELLDKSIEIQEMKSELKKKQNLYEFYYAKFEKVNKTIKFSLSYKIERIFMIFFKRK